VTVEYGMLLLGLMIVLAAGVAGTASVERKIGRMERRMGLLEAKLDSVLENLGVTQPEPHLDEVKALLRQGNKIQAIKAYRDRTGADLKEAKRAVERMTGGY
jgi:ribosomal protein L7/L12